MHTSSNLGRAGDTASLDAIKGLICENFTYSSAAGASPLDEGFAHHFKAIGGQTRARFALECCHKLGIGAQDAEIIAASVEALHNASLVLDDVQDNSATRRGHASVAHEHGDNVAIGLAHRLVATSFECLTNLSNLSQLGPMIKQINRSIADTIDGQTYDLRADRSNTSLDENLSSAKSKSGPLFALAFELPLIFAKLEAYLPFAHTAACQFGLGYQIIDDLKDRATDKVGGQNSNIALVMELTEGTTSSQDAVAKTVQIGFDCLTDAREQSRALPSDSGESLVWASERLLTQLEAFNG
jgi:geranylgeranyl pyrophosphate synthase